MFCFKAKVNILCQNMMSCAVYLIILAEFCGRSAFCGLRALLSLYLRNVLHLDENTSTLVYHVFIMTCFTLPLLGASLADGCLGRFTTILLFGVVTCLGHVLFYLGAIPTMDIDVLFWTMMGLILISVGAGGVKPCIAAFGGDQLDQSDHTSFFPVFCFVANFGGLFGTLVTPFLRNSSSCYGLDSCYALGFAVPAVLAVLAFVFFVAGTPMYNKKTPRENILGRFIRCVMTALKNKVKSSKLEKKQHWLDYAGDRYDADLLEDTKSMMAILLIIIPLPVFWSLVVQQGSRWTFQASRMNGEVFRFEILPDHIQALGPGIVLLLIPCSQLLYRQLNKCNILTSHLSKMTAGGIAAVLAFICAGALEFKLQETYSPDLSVHQSNLILINTIPCELHVTYNDEAVVCSLGKSPLTITDMSIQNDTKRTVIVRCRGDCEWGCYLKMEVLMKSMETRTVVIGSNGDELQHYSLASEDLTKPLSGNPKMRLIFLRCQKNTELKEAGITIYGQDGREHLYYVGSEPFALSNYTEMRSGSYQYFVTFNTKDMDEYNGKFRLESGGVYAFVLRESNQLIKFADTVTLVNPNKIHMLWLLPQYILISIAEVLFAIPGMEFCYSQAPKSMVTVVMAAWYFAVAAGNALVIVITQIHAPFSQAAEFFNFAIVMLLDVFLFHWISLNYQTQTQKPKDSRATLGNPASGYPLVLKPSHLSLHS